MTVKVRWKTDQLKLRLDEYEQKIYEAIRLIAEYYAPIIEEYAKTNARWTDRTANARQTMHAFVVELSKTTVALYLAHGVDYGIYLETRFQGELAIIVPTLQAHYQPISKTLKETLGDR